MSNSVLTKPSLSDLWKSIRIDVPTLALLAEVPTSCIQDMLVCRPVERVDALKVLEEISMILRETYTLNNVFVPLREQIIMDEILTPTEVARILRVDTTTVRRWISQGTVDAVILRSSDTRQEYGIKRETLDRLLDIQENIKEE